MNARFQKTPRSEDAGTARLVARTRKEVAAGAPQIAKAATNARGEPFELIPENIELWAKNAGAE